MKIFLALEIRKSVLNLTFAKSFAKSDSIKLLGSCMPCQIIKLHDHVFIISEIRIEQNK